MRLCYLSGLVGLVLIVNDLSLSSCHPLKKKDQEENVHKAVWSDGEFFEALNDYFTSSENLRQIQIQPKSTNSKALKEEIKDVEKLSSQGSEQYPSYGVQDETEKGETVYSQWNNYPPNLNAGSQTPRIRTQKVQESESSQIVAPPRAPTPLRHQDVLIFRLPEQTQQVQSTKRPSRTRANRQKERQRSQRTTKAPKYNDFADYDPLGLGIINNDDELSSAGSINQPQRPQNIQLQPIVGRPQPFFNQPQRPLSQQEQLLAQPQTIPTQQVKGQLLPQVPFSQPQIPFIQPQIQFLQPQGAFPPQVGAKPQGSLLIAQPLPQIQAQRPLLPQFAPLIATLAPEASTLQSLPEGETLENEVEKPQNLMGQLGSWIETGRKIMYLPRGVVDVIDQAMSYAEQNPYVSFVMDKMADKLFGSTKALNNNPVQTAQ